MIRINLLPQAKKAMRAAPAAAPSGTSQLWAIVYLVALVLWGAALFGIYLVTSGEVEEQKRKNAALDRNIQALMTKSAQLDDAKAKLEVSKALEATVAELHRGRLGPTRVLMELTKILSPNGGPTIDPQRLEQLRRENPLAGYNRNWDPRRLWITELREENRNVRITGLGKSNEDVAELLRRLTLSDVFDEVTLTRTEARTEQDSGLTFIGFEATAKVSY